MKRIEITESAKDSSRNILYDDGTVTNFECVFLLVGRAVYRKGHEFLLDVFARLPEGFRYRLHIVGEGPEIKELQAKCFANSNLSKHVVFMGKVAYEEIEREYQKADVLVMPSIRETTGTVLLEAMANCIPIITIGRFGGATLIDSETGWLYEGNSRDSYIENLKDIIIECIQKPEEVRRRGRNARIEAERYTWEVKDKHYQQIYRKLTTE